MASAASGTIEGTDEDDDIVNPPIRYEDGRLMVPDDPGLGVEVDRERLRALGKGVRLGVGLSPRELVDRVVRPTGG